MWMRTRFIRPSRIVPSSSRRWTKSMARNSRRSEALKLISLIRFWIARAVTGSSSR
jgi:hypothetical protein